MRGLGGLADYGTCVTQQAKPPLDAAIARIADRQHGTVSLPKLNAPGLTSSAVRKRIQRGLLHPIHRGVYAVGRPGLTAKGRWMAAVLACGDGAVLSHRSAAASRVSVRRWTPPST